MRDVRNLVATETKSSYNGGAPSIISGTRVTMRSQRSDSNPTVPTAQGSYFRSTEYESFFGFTSSSAGQSAWTEKFGKTGQFTYRRTWSGGWDRGYTYYGTAGLRPNIPNSVISRARNSANEQIKNNDFNLAQAAGEMKDTVRTISSLLSDVGNITKKFRNLARPSGLAKEWLRYQYGIKPLMSDIYSSILLIQNGLNEPLARVVASCMDDDYKLPVSANSLITITGSLKRGVEVGYTFKVTNPTLYHAYQLGLTDPLGLAWELTRMSFVVDWFLHVGDFLSGLSGPMGLDLTTGYQTSFLLNSLNVREKEFKTDADVTLTYRPVRVDEPGYSEVTCHTQSMYRVPLSTFVAPKPYLDLDLSLSQATSALALIAASRP